jgi:hypothetical protein
MGKMELGSLPKIHKAKDTAEKILVWQNYRCFEEIKILCKIKNCLI